MPPGAAGPGLFARTADRVLPSIPGWLPDDPVSRPSLGRQLAVMQLVRKYAARGGSVITVLHDLTLTVMFAGAAATVRGGQVAAGNRVPGVPIDATFSGAYGRNSCVNCTPPSGCRWLLPHVAILPGGPSWPLSSAHFWHLIASDDTGRRCHSGLEILSRIQL